jgi:signal transduction histidine kinase
VAEVARQLREMAADRGVEVRILATLPEVEVNAAAVELCLSNYLSNAIKYSDPRAPERWVEVRGALSRGDVGPPELVVSVHDNGLGVPEERRAALFQRFFRAHEDARSEVGGTGLGLSIVRETVEALGGRAWADFGAEGGASFHFALPYRRAADRA